ncbi:MAG: primary-amine oxidase [Pseudonocardiales bacterium]|nr:primary-amine oxidase [Pseudonocardiales bacterium]
MTTQVLTEPIEEAAVPQPSHPLDPLSADEVAAAVAILQAQVELTPSSRYVMISLAEPPKPADLEFDPTLAPDRTALVITYDRAAGLIHEAVVSLTSRTVLSATPVPDRFPSFLMEDMFAIEDLVRADPRWQDAMRKRGVTDFSLAMIDPWPSGFVLPSDDPKVGPRRCRPLTWMRAAPSEHGYARPIENLLVTVDMDAMVVTDVQDLGVVPIPKHPGNYSPELMFDPMNRPAFTELRTDLKPLSITQPEGPSFTVDGWSVTWQKWRLRVGFNPREGLVLHQISYDDRGKIRPIIYRASLSEMVVPYGDATPTQWNKNVFDMGEVGMGLMANSLTLGCDCLGEIYYFDGVVNDSLGQPVTIKNAVCMHEEDFGIAWKHTDFRTGEVEVRRSRRLVISTIATVGNYEYGFYWYLYTDGSIEYEVKLSGVLTTGAVADGEVPRWGQLVAPGIYGPNHQHFFSVRLDMSIDGPNNSVYEIDSVPEPNPADNPHNNAWITQASLLETEGTAARNVEYSTARYWKIVNPSVLNELGQPVAYKLMPGASVPPMLQPGSAIYDRARFVQHNLWVTAYDPDEKYAAGNYPYQSPDPQGLPEFVADDASIADTDLVVWYTVGAHHVVRPEDWPVMPVNYAGFHLKPVGFFDGNPALDLPRSEACHTDGAEHCH